MSYVVEIEVEDQREEKPPKYISGYHADLEDGHLEPELTETRSEAFVFEDLKVANWLCDFLNSAEWPARVSPTTKQSSVRLQHCYHTEQAWRAFKRLSNHDPCFGPDSVTLRVLLIVQKGDRVSFHSTIEEAEQAGEIIGFLLTKETGLERRRVWCLPLLEDKDNKEAIARARYVAQSYSSSWHANLMEGEEQ